MSPPTLKTKNYIIRKFEKKDLDLFSSYRSIKEIAKFQSWSDYTYQDAVELFEGMDYASFGVEGNWYQLAIVTKESDKLVGDIAIHFIDNYQIEIGFTISPQYQRKYVATEAISSFLDYAFGELNTHRIIAVTDTRNKAAYLLLEKLGFRREGHFIKNIFFKGTWGDEYLYALLNTEINS